MLVEHLFAQLAIPGLNVVTHDILKALGIVRAIGERLFQIGNHVLDFYLFGSIGVLEFLHLGQGPVRGKTVLKAVSIDQD